MKIEKSMRSIIGLILFGLFICLNSNGAAAFYPASNDNAGNTVIQFSWSV